MAVRISRQQAKALGLTMPTAKKRGMNKTEAAYAEILQQRVLAGEVLFFLWEAVKFRLADKTWYLPDFLVFPRLASTANAIEFHEVKSGFIRDDAMVKLKVAAEQFPLKFVMAQKTKNGWEYTEIPGKRT